MDIEEEGSGDFFITMTRKQLHEIVRESSERLIGKKFQYLEDKIMQITKCSTEQLDKLRSVLNSFKIVYKRKWVECNSTEERFLENNKEWLNTEISLPTTAPATCSQGRPSKEFGESSDRTKRRKTMELRKKFAADELAYAAQVSQRTTGKNVMATEIKEITKSPTKFRKAVANVTEDTTTFKYSASKSLSIFVEADLTREQYLVIQQANKNIYPCYSILQKAKQECYPKNEGITVTETSAEVRLQDLLDHTASRLCKYVTEVIETCTEEEKRHFELVYKWGCDGSQQTQYKQKFENEESSDSHIFQSSIVPLRLLSGQKIIWQNPLPSSPRYCRPIRIRFTKENNDVTNEEIKYVEDQEKNLRKTEIEEEQIFIKHKLLFTMVDGKVCNAATHTASTIRCYICGKTSSNFNDLTINKPEDPDTFKFGLSVLHTTIRFFEFILHLSYKLKAGVHKGRISMADDKKKIADAKLIIQKEFKDKLGLLVDVPKAGFGNTNDGNTSCRFFADPETAALITGVDQELIYRFKIILEVLSSGFEIDEASFSEYALDTAKYYIFNYNWQPMSPTLHKILTHASSVISNSILPIGQLSEEAAEARNKYYRKYRENDSPKISRIHCNQDILNRLLLTSDPYITSIRARPVKHGQVFSKDALVLLKPTQFSF